MANADRLMSTGMPAMQAQEVSKQIESGGGVPDGSVTNAKVATNANIALGKLANVAAITTAGGTTIPAGTIQSVLQAIADLADPA